MIMWTLIVKNSGGSQIIEDLGITIGTATQITLSDQFTYDEIASSDDLRTLVNASTLVINDGVGDLSASDGVKYLKIENVKDLEEYYYSKVQLSTSGQSAVHWDNITNAPAFGSLHWLEPVLARVQTIDSSPPGAPSEGDFYIDTDDDHLYKYITSSWVDQGAPSNNDRVINLDTTAQNIFQFITSVWTQLDDNSESDSVLVDDDGDGNPAQFVYQVYELAWLKIGDYDFTLHLNGGPSKHDASEIDVEGTYTDIPGTPDDLETTIDSVDSQIGIAITQNLNKAYDGYSSGGGGAGSGAGRVITADQGPVKIDVSAATNAPLELVPKVGLPTTGLADGQIAIKDGIAFIYDATCSHWLSISRGFICFGRKGSTKNQYLDHFGGGLPSNNSGLRLARAACIMSVAGQFDASGTGTFHIRKNDSASDLVDLDISSAIGGQSQLRLTGLVDFNQGDYLQCYLEASTIVADPVILIEIAWRL